MDLEAEAEALIGRLVLDTPGPAEALVILLTAALKIASVQDGKVVDRDAAHRVVSIGLAKLVGR